MTDYAYTTLLASNDYIYGVLGLYYSWKLTAPKYDFVLIITDNISKENIDIVEQAGISYTIVPRYDFKNKNSKYNITWNKFYIYSLTNYKKVLFIDADAILIENIDHVFEYAPPAFMALGPQFISGIIILENPNAFTPNNFIKFRYQSDDESVWNKIYSPSTVTNIGYCMDSIIHWSDGGDNTMKYWNYYNLNSPKMVENFINDQYAQYFCPLREWHEERMAHNPGPFQDSLDK